MTRFRDYKDRLAGAVERCTVLLILCGLAFMYNQVFDKRNLVNPALDVFQNGMLVLLAVWAFVSVAAYVHYAEILGTAAAGMPADRQAEFRTKERWLWLIWERLRYSIHLRLALLFVVVGTAFWGLGWVLGLLDGVPEHPC